METPFTNHISNVESTEIYMPAEDSFFLLDALEKDIEIIKQRNPCVALEIGSGSGIVITALSKKCPDLFCIATDINLTACRVSNRTSKENKTFVDVVRTSFTDALRTNLVDILVFNPPYVPTTDDEWKSLKIQYSNSASEGECDPQKTHPETVRAWAGGLNGRRVIDELLTKIDSILSPNGIFYILLLKENHPQEIIENFERIGFVVKVFLQRKIPGEHLFILKITRI